MAISHPGVARSLRFMWDHCQEPIGVGDIRSAPLPCPCAISPGFHRQHRPLAGQELQRIRIEHAKKLLSDSNSKMEVIAKMSGYESANSFWVAFKRIAGISPKQYRKKFASHQNQLDIH